MPLRAPLGTLYVSALTLALAGCPDKPPPAARPLGDAAPTGFVEPSPGVPPGSPTPATEGAERRPSSYPATPTRPPPVAPPAGKGLEVALHPYVVVDQFGYRPEMTKVAILVNPQKGWNAGDRYEPGAELEVRTWTDGAPVFKGPAVVWNGGKTDDSAGDSGSWFDFSEVKAQGLYYVYDPKNRVRSHPFQIATDVYKPVLKASMKTFYFNRANFAKRPPHSCYGKKCWSIGADYLGPGQDREARSVKDRDNAKTARDLSGGWWDAGDTNKYVTFSGEPVHQLLTAYQERPRAFGDDFDIPESGNGIPDIIDELLIELAWLKKMQPADLKGGVLIKVGNVEYGDPLPDESRLKRFYYPGACSSATITAAGQFAHAALVLKGFPRFAEEAKGLGKRAADAWTHYHANPRSEACDDGSIRSGDADTSLRAQDQAALIAAVYLFALTSDTTYGEYVKKNHGVSRVFEDERWSVYSPAQGDALIHYAGLANADPALKQKFVEQKVRPARSSDTYRFQPEQDLYRAYMRTDTYHWGSNNARAGNGNTNYDLVQYGLVPEGERATYLERAAGILHSFHGVNPMQIVYLSNMYDFGGDACADEMYHAWFRDKDPLWDNARISAFGPAPGYVTGGPNKQYCEGQDPSQTACARSPVREQPPEKAYVDMNTGWEPTDPFDRSWELNEPAIYYQASYVRLVSKFVGN